MKLLDWIFGNRSMAKGASENRLTHLSICWRRTPGSPETACRQRWMTGLAREIEPWGAGWGVWGGGVVGGKGDRWEVVD